MAPRVAPASALGLALALALAAPAAIAQTQIPGTFNPITPLRPPRAPGVQPGLPPPAPPIPAPTTPATYAITSAAVVGATAYSPAVLGGLIAGLTGLAVPAARIEAARTAIVARYRRDGYLYTTVDAVVGDGRLRFVVIEGRIVDVRLAGNIGPAGTQVLRFLDHLVQQRPLRQGSLERWLLLASDIPGVTVRSILNPTDTPGDLVLVAQLSRKPFDVQAIADNRAFRQTGPEEYLLIGDLNSFTEFGERTEFDFYHTFNGTEVFGEASTQFFIGGSGLQGRLYGGAGDATPSGDLRAIGYNGRTIVFGGQLSYPLIRSRPQTLNLVGQFDAIESDISTTTGPDGARVRSSFDSLRVFRAGFDYSLLDTWLGGAHPATDSAMLRLSQGVPGLGASSNGATDAPRSGERVDFFKAVMQVSRTQTLFSPWADASVALQPTLIGQVANSVLPPEEKYYLGGPHFNRGYYYGQVTGDNAFVTSNELQLITPLPWHVVPSAPLDATFYLFYDYGRTWENQAVDPNRVLNSAGGGVRLNASRYLEVDLEGDWRINRYPLGGGVSPLQGAAFYWSVTLRY